MSDSERIKALHTREIPSCLALEIILVRPSITHKKISGDKGQPCLNPLDILKKGVGFGWLWDIIQNNSVDIEGK